MSKNLILKSHANEVLGYIQGLGLNPTDFHWEEVYSTKSHPLIVSKLIHNSTSYFFIFDFLNDAHYCEYSPGKEKHIDYNYPGGWKGQFNYFIDWISNLTREIDSPDFWGGLKNEKGIIEATTLEESNEFFTNTEKTKLKSSLEEIKSFIISTNKLGNIQLEFIENRFKYLLESSERLGKKDWLNISLGVFINIILYLSLPSEAAGQLFRFVSTSLQWLIKESINLLK